MKQLNNFITESTLKEIETVKNNVFDILSNSKNGSQLEKNVFKVITALRNALNDYKKKHVKDDDMTKNIIDLWDTLDKYGHDHDITYSIFPSDYDED